MTSPLSLTQLRPLLVNVATQTAAEVAARATSTRLRPGTVALVPAGAGGIVSVTLDGDPGHLLCDCLVGLPAVGERVMVLLTEPHGAYVVGYPMGRVLNPPTLMHTSIELLNGTSTGLVSVPQVGVSTFDLGAAQYPLRMEVRAWGRVGFSASAHIVYLRLVDRLGAGSLIAYGYNRANDYIIDIDSRWQSFTLAGGRDYGPGEVVGCELLYAVDTSNVYLQGAIEVRLIPRRVQAPVR